MVGSSQRSAVCPDKALKGGELGIGYYPGATHLRLRSGGGRDWGACAVCVFFNTHTHTPWCTISLPRCGWVGNSRSVPAFFTRIFPVWCSRGDHHMPRSFARELRPTGPRTPAPTSLHVPFNSRCLNFHAAARVLLLWQVPCPEEGHGSC